jgi:hypothetical protein
LNKFGTEAQNIFHLQRLIAIIDVISLCRTNKILPTCVEVNGGQSTTDIK